MPQHPEDSQPEAAVAPPGATAQSAADDAPLIRIADESPVSKHISVEIAAGQVDRRFADSYRDLRHRADVRGFRRGKVPRAMLRKLYASAVARDVERELISQTLPKVMERYGAGAVGEPHIESQPVHEGKPFRYEIQLEQRPELQLGELSDLAVTRSSAVVEEPAIDGVLDKLRRERAVPVEYPPETLAATGDWVVAKLTASCEGESVNIHSEDEVHIELGAGKLMPELEEGLLGARSGENRTIRVPLPDNFSNPQLAGKELEFHASVLALQRREPPELDDAFAQDLDFDDLAELRRAVREDLERNQDAGVKLALRRDLVDALIERIPFEIPPRLLAESIRRRAEMLRGMGGRGTSSDGTRLEESLRAPVERSIRESWILSAVAAQHGLEVDAREIEENAARLAATQDQSSEPASRERFIEIARSQLLEGRAVEFLLARATVTEAEQD